MVTELQWGPHGASRTLKWAAVLLTCDHAIFPLLSFAYVDLRVSIALRLLSERSCHPPPVKGNTEPYSPLCQLLSLANVWCTELIKDKESKEDSLLPSASFLHGLNIYIFQNQKYDLIDSFVTWFIHNLLLNTTNKLKHKYLWEHHPQEDVKLASRWIAAHSKGQRHIWKLLISLA